MANKREFKKFIEAVGASVCDEMMVAYYNIDGADRDAIAKAIESVLVAVEKARVNAGTEFDRKPRSFDNEHEYRKAKTSFVKAMYKKVIADFSASIDAAVKAFNAAIPAEVKAANKA